jgi:hypothetical protein
MFPSRHIFLAFGLLLFEFEFAGAQTVVNSTYTGQCQGVYSDPNCWSPPEVPNNSPSRQYNVTVPAENSLRVDINATVSNLNLNGYATFYNFYGAKLIVEGKTTVPIDDYGHIIFESGSSGPNFLDAGALSTFSDHTLRGRYYLDGLAGAVTFQFDGADISTLSEGLLSLGGPLARVTDESGNDGLRNLARIDNSGTLKLTEHDLTIAIPFTNDGILSVGQDGGATVFSATASLTNFDSAGRTLIGGTFVIGNFFGPRDVVSQFRFNGADVVNNGSVIQLESPGSRIVDLAGNDGLRNLAYNLAEGSLRFYGHDFTTPGSFQNDGLLFLQGCTFIATGPLVNFDSPSHTISGGAYELIEAALQFSGADVVRNAASITLTQNSRISDLMGVDGLRNFGENLDAGTFVLGPDQTFTTSANFTNSGRIETMATPGGIPDLPQRIGKFVVSSGFSYTQTAGTTVNAGTLQANTIRILGGTLSTTGLIKGDLFASNAVVVPAGPATFEIATLDGNLILNSGSRLQIAVRVGSQVDSWSSITGHVALGGSLDVMINDETFLASNAVITLLQSDGPITGSFDNAPNGARVPTADGKGSFVIVYEANAIKLTQFRANPPPAQLFNISSRGFLFAAAADDSLQNRTVLIGGFIVTGTMPKKVALRGIGPSLVASGVDPVLADPVLELHGASGGLILANDDWRDTQAAEVIQSQIAPGNDRESVIITTLVPASYTVVLKEKNGRGGNGVVEVYDLSGNDTSKLANISTRGYTDSNNVLIGGIIAGGGQANAEIVVRAIGPELQWAGVFNALADPTLEVRDNNGAVVAFNDDWLVNGDDFVSISELTPRFTQESAMRLSLPAGNYTALVRPKGNIGGVALVEFYDLRR